MVEKITESKIITIFLNDYSRRVYLREAASELKKPHQSIKPHIIRLVEKKILIEIKRKNVIEYCLNFKNKIVYDYLTVAEKDKAENYLKSHILIRTLFEKLSKYFKDSSFLIFGSGSERIDKEADIDLLMIGKDNIKKDIGEFEEIYSKKIHMISVKNLKELSFSFVKEIYKKHLILNDTESFIRFFGGLHEQNKLV